MIKIQEETYAILGKHPYTLEQLFDLRRLQKELYEVEGLIATLEECASIWQKYSCDLCESWSSFPDKDEDILEYIKSSDFFTSFEEYSK